MEAERIVDAEPIKLVKEVVKETSRLAATEVTPERIGAVAVTNVSWLTLAGAAFLLVLITWLVWDYATATPAAPKAPPAV